MCDNATKSESEMCTRQRIRSSGGSWRSVQVCWGVSMVDFSSKKKMDFCKNGLLEDDLGVTVCCVVLCGGIKLPYC